MRNSELILKKLDDDLKYLYEQENRLKPVLQLLEERLYTELTEERISVLDVFEMFIRLQEQYTNSVILITKIKEVLEFKD